MVFFAGHFLPEDTGQTHFMVVGATGSGKTLTFKMMMSSLIPEFFQEKNVLLDRRVVVFDEKQDIYSFLIKIGINSRDIIILNPFDNRCYAWNMAEDITGPDTALQVATIFIPEENNSNNRYFSDAARAILTGVIRVFIRARQNKIRQNIKDCDWLLSDVLAVMRNPNIIRHVLSHTEEGRELISLHLQEGKTANDILSTAGAYLAPFEVVGALWKQAKHKIGLRDFLKKKAILILGNNQEARAPIEAINRIIFQRLTQLVLAQPENPRDNEQDKRRIWFFLDELRKLGKLPGLDDLMNNGRSKGACVVIGFQDIQGLRSVYGQEVADEITSMCSSFMVLRLAGTVTPKWAAELFGEIRFTEITKREGVTHNPQGNMSFDEGKNENNVQKTLYYDSLFKNLPILRPPDFGIHAFCFSPSIVQKQTVLVENERKLIRKFAPFEVDITWEKIGSILREKNLDLPTEYADFCPWIDSKGDIDEEIKYLKSLKNDDWDRIGLNRYSVADKKEKTREKNEKNNLNGAAPLKRKGVWEITKASGDKVEIM